MGSWRKLSDADEIRAVHRRNLGILMIADQANIDALAVHIQTFNTARTFVASRPISRTGALREGLERLAAGTRLNGIWGARDATAGEFLPERERMFHALQPQSRFRVIAGAGHWVAYEAAAAFNTTLTELLTT